MASGSSERVCTLTSLLLAICIVAPAAFAQLASPTVFHSPQDDGQPAAGATGISPAGPQDLYLWLSTGDQPSGSAQVVCQNGLGDEVCAFQIELEAAGGFSFVGFNADTPPGLPYVVNFDPPNRLVVNRVNSGPDPAGDFGEIRIGTLSVVTTGDGQVRLESTSRAVNAQMFTTAILGNPIAVPEPRAELLLLAGALLLILLTFLRRRRSSVGGTKTAARAFFVACLALAWTVAAVPRAYSEGLVGDGSQLWTAEDLGATDPFPLQVEFGRVVASGDFDNDGYLDMAVGDEAYKLTGIENAGAVFVAYGTATGISAVGSQIWTQNSPGILDDSEAFDRFGAALAVGDFDGDGYDDLAVGVPQEETNAAVDSGMIHVIFGSSGGLSSSGNEVWHQNSPNIVHNNEAYDNFGEALAAADFDNDGYDDLAIGVPGEDLAEAQAGMFMVIYGSSGGLSTANEAAFSQGFNMAGTEAVDDRVGSVLVTGNFNGDAYADLAIGVPNEDTSGDLNSGALHIVFGSSTGLTTPGNEYWHPDVSGIIGVTNVIARFGAALAAGDFDGDGYDDIAAGSPGAPGTAGSEVGYLNVIFGSSGGLTAAGDQVFSQGFGGLLGVEGALNRFGWSLASGDFDNDGHDDLAVGAPFDNVVGFNDGGNAHVIYGTPNGLSTVGNQLWNQDDPLIEDAVEQADRLAFSLAAGDLNGDGSDDLILGVLNEYDNVAARARGAVNVIYARSCGNGATTHAEECDDGNNTSEDGCSDVCISEFCGDLVIQPGLGEECEDGNGADWDGCSASCRYPDEIPLFGAAQGGGTVELTINGVLIVVNTTFGDSNYDVMSALVAAVNADPTFQGMGVDAQLVGERFVTYGTVGLFDITDPGLTPTEILVSRPELPGLKRWEQITVGTPFAMPGPFPGPDQLEAFDFFGHDVTPIGDLNGDGFVDIAVGAGGEDDGGSFAGAVWVLFLAPSGFVQDYVKLTGLGEMSGSVDAGDFFGRGLGAMDLNDDGRMELLVGANHLFDTDPSALHVIFLKGDGTVQSTTKIEDASSDDRFGNGIAPIGDLDLTDVSDDKWVAVGAPRNDDLGTDAGAVWLFSLDASGNVKAGASNTVKLTIPGAVEPGDLFGYDVASIGDLDRDGVKDLAVGAVFTDVEDNVDAGGVFIVFLNADGSVKSHVELESTLDDSEMFGSGLTWIPASPGGVGGTLVVGSEGYNNTGTRDGRVDFIALGADGNEIARGGPLSTALVPLGSLAAFDPFPATEATSFGDGIAAIGDLNGDGFQDIVVTSRDAEIDLIQQIGAAYVLFLRGTDDSGYADYVVSGAGEAALGPVDVNSVPYGDFTVQFVDNAARGGDTNAVDIVVWRPHGKLEASVNMTVWVSEDGASWTQEFSGSVAPQDDVGIDLDASIYSSTSRIRFVRVLQEQQCSVIGCLPEPTVTAIEAVTNANLAQDLDYDGIVDFHDNCPTVPNLLQGDGDSDGIGDYCDNCIGIPNNDQADGNGNGVGDVCDGASYELIDVGTPADPEWEIRVTCPGSSSLTNINLGVRIPQGVDPATAWFGGTTFANRCQNWGSNPPNVPTGYVPGIGCTNADAIGERIANDGTSGIILPPSNNDPSGARGDTIYLALARDPVFSSICEANENVALGRLHFPPPGGAVPSPGLTLQGAGTPGLGLQALLFPPLRLARRARSFDPQDPQSPRIEVAMEPVNGQTTGQESDWKLCVRSLDSLSRVSIGLSVPTQTAAGDMRLAGCDTTPTGLELRRDCTGAGSTPFAGEFAAVDPMLTYTLGPDGSDDSPVMFVVMEASDYELSADDEPTFAASPTQSACLGVIQVDTVAMQGIAPDLDLNGLSNLPTQPPFAEADGSLTEVSTLDISTNNSYAAPEDSDGDGVRDESDRCPYFYTESVVDRGGLLTTTADGIGDVCQCSETDDTGKMLLNEADLDLLRQASVDLPVANAVRLRCSVRGGTECDVLDTAVLQRALAIGDPTMLQQVCEAAVPPIDGAP